MHTCSVIIVNYNTGKLLTKVVQSVLQNSAVTDIIIVDNNSHDNSMDFLVDNAKVKKYFRKKNHGFASSCNYGRNKVTSDCILFLNPDCLVSDGTMRPLLKKMQADEDVAVVGCQVNNPDGSEQRASRRRLPTLWRAFKTYSGLERLAGISHCFAGVNLNHQPMPKSWQTVEAISGAFILIRARVFDELNGFDEGFPMHFEDLDLFKRTQDSGYLIAFNPNVSVIHHQGTSSRTNTKVAKMKKQGLQRYFHKHCSKFSYYLVKTIFYT